LYAVGKQSSKAIFVNQNSKQSRGDRRTSTPLHKIPPSAIRAIESSVERQFFLKALDLMQNDRWQRFQRTPQSALLAVRDFALAYSELLEWAFVEYVELLANAINRNRIVVQWRTVEQDAFAFVERFFNGNYHHPFTGDFLIFGPEFVSQERAVAAYRRLHEIAPWYSVSPDDWERIFFPELKAGAWRHRAIEAAKEQIELLTHTSGSSVKNKSLASAQQRSSTVPTWNELKNRKSISRTEAASFLGPCAEKTVRNRFRDRRLTKTSNGRVACDDKLLTELKKVHGPGYR
jgi:hypothetical protein